jgi:hypothetical protein
MASMRPSNYNDDSDNNDLISVPVGEQMAHQKVTFEWSLIKELFTKV